MPGFGPVSGAPVSATFPVPAETDTTETALGVVATITLIGLGVSAALKSAGAAITLIQTQEG